MAKDLILIPITGGMTNAMSAIRLFLRQQGELVNLVNADLSVFGEIKILRNQRILNATKESDPVHSVFKANNVIFAGVSNALKYWDGSSLSDVLSSPHLDPGTPLSFAHVGKYIYMCNGSAKKSVYIAGPTGCDWGQPRPATAPTVGVDVGAGGTTKTTDAYTCYYRYKITLPDGTVIRTALSAGTSATLTNTTDTFLWSNLVHSTFTGATTVAIELFRTQTGWSGTFLIAEIASGTTTYTDDISDVAAQIATAFDQTGHYPPPDIPDLVAYHPGSDRLFVARDGNVYWSEAGKYHIFVFSASSGTYSNVNSVFLDGEKITAMLLIDEQMYFGSQKGWRRLRGTDPGTVANPLWRWEDTSARKGPVSSRAVTLTFWGALYPGNDGRLWMFNGFDARPLLEHFVFDKAPGPLSHATFDGRFYRLYYPEDTIYPSVVVDFFGYPQITPRVTKSTYSADASYYDEATDDLILGDSSGYVRRGKDGNSATLTIKTPEIPVEALEKLGDMAALVMRINSQGADITIVPYHDGIAASAITAFSTDAFRFQKINIPLGDYYTLQFEISVTSAEDVKVGEPLVLSKSFLSYCIFTIQY